MQLEGKKSNRAKDSKKNHAFFSPKAPPKPLFFQPKLTIGPVDDVYEREADAVADRVMRMSIVEGETILPVQRMCTECEEEEKLQRKEQPSNSVTTEAPPVVGEAINSASKPLAEDTRSFMENRMGYDFSNVKIHTGSIATKSAQSINALAYTSGNNIVFNEGQYAPDTKSGKALLAHELTHVVQQNVAYKSNKIQRACGTAAIGPTSPDCNLISKNPEGERFLFKVNCDEFAAGEQARLLAFSSVISPSATINILGLASSDGPRDFNESLSCKRAEAAKDVLTLAGIPLSRIALVEATGPIGAPSNSNMRAVMVDLSEPLPPSTGECSEIKRITVDMLSFRGSNRDPFADLAAANRIFKHCCVEFVPRMGSSVDPDLSDPLMGPDTTFERATRGVDSTEEQALIPAVTTTFNLGGRLRVLYFERINPSARATSHRKTGSTPLTVNHVYMTNRAASRTLAHEFGHILLDGNFHHLPADNLMHPSNTATGSNLTPDQCKTIRENI